MNELSDERLIELLRAGDKAAEEALYERYRRLVCARARAYYLIGADRDDLIQEGMIGLFKAVTEFDPVRSPIFRAFADHCVVRQMMTAIKKATRKKHGPLNSYISLNGPVDPSLGDRPLSDVLWELSCEDPAETLINRDELSRITKHLNERLSGYEKRVLELFIQGMSYRQIAQSLKRSEKSVDNALQRIKRKLEK